MKYSRMIAKSALIATFATAMEQADTRTFWVSGVNQESDWVDVNKNAIEGDEHGYYKESEKAYVTGVFTIDPKVSDS